MPPEHYWSILYQIIASTFRILRHLKSQNSSTDMNSTSLRVLFVSILMVIVRGDAAELILETEQGRGINLSAPQTTGELVRAYQFSGRFAVKLIVTSKS